MACILVLAALLGLKAAGLAGAAGLNFQVNSTADALDATVGDGLCRTSAGACTLRAAIQEANAIPGGDVIHVPGGVYELAIPPVNQNDITTGDLDITDNLEISGAGAGSTFVDGGSPPAGAPPDVRGLDRIFEVLVDGGDVRFSGLTLSDGYAAEYGGAIMNNSTAAVSVTAAVLRGNVAGKTGGAIDNHVGGTVAVSDSTLSGNYAGESASAINNNRDGTLTIADSSISGNSAAAVGLDETLRGAGAIANNAELDARGTITVTDSEISNNRAGGGRNGAGISNDGGGILAVNGTSFSKNVSTSDGGAIFNGTGSVTVTNSTFSENAAKDGGAIAGTGGTIEVLDSTFSKNSAEGLGGAMLNSNQGGITILNSTFRENSAITGGGFSNEGTGLVTVENATFTKNVAIETASLVSGEGGGMHSNSGGEVVIAGGSFTENEARGGGGFSNEGGGQVTITGTRFSANQAEAEGGGILVQSGSVRMLNIDVVGNVSSSALEGGGGVSYHGDKAVAVGESAAIENSRIRDNKSGGDGGGIDSRGDGPLAITTTAITGNTAAVGGAIHHVGDAPLEVTRSTLSDNSAGSGGGVLTDGDGEATLENTTVSGNRASQFGGGVLISSRLALRNSTVTNNVAASGGGVDNGGGDLVGDGTVFVANSIVANNPAGGNCAGTVTSRGGNVENADSCQLDALSDQPGTDPRLGPLADNGGPTQTHALLAGSPAQEKAVCTELDPCPAVDQRGLDRPQFEGFDAGAYESELTPGGGGTQQCAGLTERPVPADFDTWVSQGAPNGSFASDSILNVRSQSGTNERVLVHFTLPPVPPGCKLVAATLRLHASAATEGRTLEALRVLSAWTDVGVTWANQPATATSPASTQSGLGLLEWDVLTQAREMYASGDHGFLIRDRTENATGAQSVHSSEKGADRPPELVLVFDDPDAPPPPGACPKVPQVFSADRDSWVSESSPSNNFGSDSTLKVKSQTGADARTLVRFPLPILPSGCTTIASALLRVEATSAKDGRTLEVLQVGSAWSEAGVTWSNQPAVTGPAAVTPSAQGPLEWSVIEQVLGMYTSANHGFLIRDADENGVGDEQTINSRDKVTDDAPKLVIVFDDSTPETTIDAGPASPTNATAATFTFSSDRADATFECSLDGAAFEEACESQLALEGLAEGGHELEVRATRRVRAVDPTPATYGWTVDLTAPEAAIVSGPADPTNETSAEFSFAGSDNVDELSQLRFQCRLDDPAGDWAGCASPIANDLLAPGRHAFEVRAIDRAGNVGAAASRAWTIDLTAPETTIDSGPADPSKSSSAEFAFSAEEEARFECSLDAAAFESCSQAHTYQGLGEGGHIVEVRAIDRAGNVDAEPAVYGWTIDLTPPETAVDSGPADPTNRTSASFAFSSVDGVSFECRLDGAAFSPCASPESFAGLAEGGHAFDVRAIDAAGNVDLTPARYSWTIDLTAPETVIDSGPDDPTNRTAASFAFSASEAASFECRLDGVEFAQCESPADYDRLAEGRHSFEVRALDRAGNVEGSPALAEWTIDLTAPETVIDSGPADPSKSSSAEFAFSAEEEARFECSLDAAAFEPCSQAHTYQGLGEGGHVVEVRAVDRAGNVDAQPAVYGWTIDLTAPDASIGARPGDPTNSTSASFGFSADEEATFECSLDGARFTACVSPQGYVELAEGAHAFDVRAIDRAGNVDSTPARAVWTIDLTAPETSIDEQPGDPTSSASARFVFSANEAASFECRLDGEAFTACSSPASYEGLAEGRHSFEVRATDTAGNLEPIAARAEWTVDVTPPETAIDVGPTDPSNSGTADFVFSATEESTFACALDGAPFASCSSSQSYQGLTEGAHSVEVRAVDRAGNVDAQPAVYRWVVDLTPPETTIDAAPADRTNSTSASFVFSAGEAASFECRLDGGAFLPCDSPQGYEGLGEGGHTLDVRAIDVAGNVDSTPARAVWTIDLTAPETSIDEQPSDPTSSSSATFAFSADEQATFACSLDGAPFSACSSPMGYVLLGEGRHTFEVRAIDGVGNVDATPASHAWTVDQTAPQTTISAAPPDPTNSTAARFHFSSDEPGSGFACSLDGGAFAACGSPADYADLGPGTHSFHVRATDAAGNSDPTAASHTWTVDVAPPDTRIDAQPADPTNATDAGFSFSSEPGASFECRLDGGAFDACPGPQLYSGLAEGRRTFDVRAVDAAGNVDPSPARYSWTIDVTSPDASIDSAPGDPTSSTSATFTFSADEPGAMLECSLDAAAFAPCASPREYVGLAAGAHELRVRATDAAGNTDPTPARHVWVIDRTAPETTITDGPADPTNDGTATFAFTGSDDRTAEAQLRFECRLDGAAEWLECSSPRLYLGLLEGEHTFEVRAVDRAGNADTTPAAHTWTVDRTAPETTIDAGPAATTTTTSASFSFSASEASTFECALDGGAFAPCTSPREYAALSVGRHEFRVRATDAAANTDASPAIHVWTIEPPPDTTVPETTIDSGPAALSSSASASFSFSSSKPNSTFECSLDGAPFAGCSSPRQYAGLANGTHQFRVRARDAAGVDQTPATHNWTVDTAAPQTTITSGPPALTSSANASFSFSSNEAGSTFECSLDSAAFAACSSPRQYASLAGGTHEFRVRATDVAGNVDASPATYSWTVDAVAPETTIDSGPPATTTSTSASFAFSANETGSTFECSLDGAAFAACTSPRQFTALAVGAHQFRVRATDAAGNTDASPATSSWTITAPSPTCSSVTLSAVADAWIDESSPSTNKGDDSILKVQSKGPRDNFRALVRFTLPPLPQGCVVDTATLRLYAASMKPGRVIQALQLAAGWAENSVSWISQPSTTGPAATTASGFGYLEWDVRSQVQAMFSETVSHGFLIRDAAEGADAEQQFHSREKGENAPQLVLRFAQSGG